VLGGTIFKTKKTNKKQSGVRGNDWSQRSIKPTKRIEVNVLREKYNYLLSFRTFIQKELLLRVNRIIFGQ